MSSCRILPMLSVGMSLLIAASATPSQQARHIFTITGKSASLLGSDVGRAGDIDKDGFEDIYTVARGLRQVLIVSGRDASYLRTLSERAVYDFKKQ